MDPASCSVDGCRQIIEILHRLGQQSGDLGGRVVLLLALRHVEADDSNPELVVQRSGKRADVRPSVPCGPSICDKAGGQTRYCTTGSLGGQRLGLVEYRFRILAHNPVRRQLVLGGWRTQNP